MTTKVGGTVFFLRASSLPSFMVHFHPPLSLAYKPPDYRFMAVLFFSNRVLTSPFFPCLHNWSLTTRHKTFSVFVQMAPVFFGFRVPLGFFFRFFFFFFFFSFPRDTSPKTALSFPQCLSRLIFSRAPSSSRPFPLRLPPFKAGFRFFMVPF